MIKDWGKHLQKLTAFWGTNLFSTLNYKGNPVIIHQKVDTVFRDTIA